MVESNKQKNIPLIKFYAFYSVVIFILYKLISLVIFYYFL